jgi:hypothetical protein
MEQRNCVACGKVIRGRIDKKYCDFECRNNYNNRLRKGGQLVRQINNILSKNHRILKKLLPEETVSIIVTKEILFRFDFNFSYFTHTYTNPESKIYFYCYDYGYLPIENDRYLIVRQKNIP